jgi:hypothetical protein
MRSCYAGLVRTTIDIDDPVLDRAKRLAANSGKTLGEVVSEALTSFLSARATKKPAPPFELIVRGKKGGRFPSLEEIVQSEEEDDVRALGVGRAARDAPT